MVLSAPLVATSRGTSYFWQQLVLYPAFENWVGNRLVPWAAGAISLAMSAAGHSADWEWRDSGGRIKTRGRVDSGGSHTGRRPSWPEQLLTHTERKILEQVKNAKP